MKIISRVLSGILIVQTAVTPFVSARAADSGEATIREALSVVQGFQDEGWILQDSEQNRLTAKDLVQTGGPDLYILPPSKTGLSEITYRVKTKTAGNSLKLFLAIYRAKDLTHAVSSRVITIDPARSAVDNRVEMEQTLQSMSHEVEKSVAFKSTKASTLASIIDLFVPSAHAGMSGTLLKAGMISIMLGVVAFELPILANKYGFGFKVFGETRVLGWMGAGMLLVSVGVCTVIASGALKALKEIAIEIQDQKP